jgi:hypothetical protein
MSKLTLTATASGTSSYDLTALGSVDWFAYSEGGALNRKAGTNVIAISATDGLAGFSAAEVAQLTWTNGTPTAAGSSRGGIAGPKVGGEYVEFTIPASTTDQIYDLFVGMYGGATGIEGYLTDGSAPAVSDSTTAVWTGGGAPVNGRFRFTFAAASDGQFLKVRVKVPNGAGQQYMNIQGAALSAAAVVTAPGAPTITSIAAGNGSVSISGTAPASTGGSPITGYMGTAYPSGLTGTSATLPVNISGLTNGVQQTFKIKAMNDPAGYGPESAGVAATPTNVNNPPTFPGGSIANISGQSGNAIAPVDVHGLFADSDALTYSKSPNGTAWPAGLSIDPSTGIISGTVAASGTTTGLRVRATDTAAQSVDSNAFNVVIASGPTQVALTDANVVWSPGNWDDFGTRRQSNTPGAYARFGFTGTSVAVKLDVSHMVAASLGAGNYPTVRMLIDGAFATDIQLNSGTTSVSVTGLANGSHTCKFSFEGVDWGSISGSIDRWNTPVNAIRVTGFTLDAGASCVASALSPRRAKKGLFYGDSILEGYESTGGYTNQSSTTIAPHIADAMGIEYGMVGFSAQGFNVAGQGGVPAFNTAWSSFSAGRSRLSAGVFTEQPDYVFVEHGTNGPVTQAHVATSIANMRGAAPSARLFYLIPAGGFARAEIKAAVAAALAAGDAKVHAIDLGAEYEAGLRMERSSSYYGVDAYHPNQISNGRNATKYAMGIQAALDGVAVAPEPVLPQRTFTIKLATGKNADESLILAANLSGLKITHHDELPGSFTVPRYQSNSETTDANGDMTYACGSTLAIGASGHVTVIGPNGLHYNAVVVAS